MAELLSVVLSRPIRYANPSAGAYLRRLVAEGQPLPYALVTLALYTTARLGPEATATGDVARLLGREPIGLRHFIEARRAA